ncbi:hypothetical protein JKP88DRAFT_346923 [Tribonema minus]|uniref:PA14 domain-containing protein n=1 Tax=Tribonema minus TaxID=303371 RepID=A0A836CC08_9STRA|nr:hypothetical protein JKP88DRAFT_346923 [Tribonema minus]
MRVFAQRRGARPSPASLPRLPPPLQLPRATPLPLLPADPAHIAEAAKVPLAPLPAAAARELRRLFDLAKSDKAALVRELEGGGDPLGVYTGVGGDEGVGFRCPPPGERVSEPDLRDLRVMEEFRGGRRDAFVYFQHMRKAGGTAFCDLAKRNMPTRQRNMSTQQRNMQMRQVPKHYCMSDRRGALASPPWSERDYLLSQMRQKGFRITANEWDALPRSTLTLPGAVFVTMLRSPLDRWYSQYRFEHVEHRDGSPKNVTMPFERWYPRYAAGSQGHNYYVKAFTGEENPGAAALDTQRDKAGDPLYKKALLWSWRKFKDWGHDVEWDAFARAVDALRRFHLVLVTELMDGAGGPIEAALGWEQPPQLVRPHEKHLVRPHEKHVSLPSGLLASLAAPAWRNGTAPSSARDSLSAAAWQDLAEANAFDLVLYHWARRLFLERMACETAAAAADTESTAEAAADRAAAAVAAAAAAAAAPTVDVYAAPALPWKAADIDARGSGAHWHIKAGGGSTAAGADTVAAAQAPACSPWRRRCAVQQLVNPNGTAVAEFASYKQGFLVNPNGTAVAEFASYEQGFLVNPNGTALAEFASYEQGFVGTYGDPTTTYYMETMMETGGDLRALTMQAACPGVLVPGDKGVLFCGAKERGVCDTRSGTCVCSDGYMGTSCELCQITHYMVGGLCYPRHLCPGACSGNGECDYQVRPPDGSPRRTGTCACSATRTGADCSLLLCEALFDALCAECTAAACTRCEAGYYVEQDNSAFDPRCVACSRADGCLACADLLLNSVRRVGQRTVDPPLPPEELTRELGRAMEFGTLDPHFFDDAEVYRLAFNKSVALNATAAACAQGVASDAAWTCAPKATSHVYEVDEKGDGTGTLRLMALRTGGGMGEMSFSYAIRHLTTDGSDVTAHSQWAANAPITMAAGVIEASWLLTIHDDDDVEADEASWLLAIHDDDVEADEAFEVYLLDPRGGARLGSQRRATVWIRDDDALTTLAPASTAAGTGIAGAVAGYSAAFTVTSMTPAGIPQTGGGDTYVATIAPLEQLPPQDAAPEQQWSAPQETVEVCIVPAGGAEYNATYTVLQAGEYSMDVQLAHTGGLRATYYATVFGAEGALQPPLHRASVIFITHRGSVLGTVDWWWDLGPVAPGAPDFVSARWEGRLAGAHNETYTFTVLSDAESYVELWIDATLILEGPGGALLSGAAALTAGRLYPVTVLYRHNHGPANIQLRWSSASMADAVDVFLRWSSASVADAVVPHTALYYLTHIDGSPLPLTVLSDVTNATTSEAFGSGTVSAVVGSEAAFVIVPRDAHGNLRAADAADVTALDLFTAVLTLMQDVGHGGGGDVITCAVAYDAARGAHVARYTPMVSGAHALRVTYQTYLRTDEADVWGSPFVVSVAPGPTSAPASVCSVAPGPTSAPASVCSGGGLGSTVAGSITTFVLTAHDAFDNLRLIGGDAFEATLYHTMERVVATTVVQDNLDGSYAVSVQPFVSGTYELVVSLAGDLACGSPYAIYVAPSAGYGPTSTASGAVAAAVATLPNAVVVQGRDRYGNLLLTVATDVLTATLTGPVEKGSVPGTSAVITTRSMDTSGTFTVSYTPDIAGINTLALQLNGLDIMSSPLSVDVTPGPSRGAATAAGAALSHAIAGQRATFAITARDSASNPTADTASPSPFTVLITATTAPTNATTAATVTETEPGSSIFAATYNLTVAGGYSIAVTDMLSGQAIVGSPFLLQVSADYAFAPFTQVTRAYEHEGDGNIKLQAVDMFGNAIPHGGERFEVEWSTLPQVLLVNAPLALPATAALLTPGVTDRADGTYTALTTGLSAGDYNMSVYVLESGGLWGTYFRTREFMDQETARYTKSVVDFNWGAYFPGAPQARETVATATPLSAAFPADFFSASFDGMLLPQRSEEHVLIVTTDGDSSAELVVDGVTLLPLVPPSAPRTRLATERKAAVRLVAGRPVTLKLKYVHEQNEASLLLEWMSPSMPRQTVPAGALLTKRYGSSSAVTIWPKPAVPRMSTAVGAALSAAVAGARQAFDVTARDSNGDRVWIGGAAVTAYAIGPGGAMVVADVTDRVDGTYQVEYTAYAAGPYALSVLLGGVPAAQWDTGYSAVERAVADLHVSGSPFALYVAPAAASAAHSVIYGTGAITATAGQPAQFTIRARDAFGNRVLSEDDAFAAQLDSQFLPQRTLSASVTSVGAGEYGAAYTLTAAGMYALNVSLGGEAVGGADGARDAPLEVRCLPAAAAALNTTCDNCHQAFGRGPIAVGAPKALRVTARDAFGNAAVHGGEEFYVSVSDVTSGTPTVVQVLKAVDNGDGGYDVLFQAPHAGSFEIAIQMAARAAASAGSSGGGGSGLTAQYYSDSRALSDETLQRSSLVATLIDAQVYFNWGSGPVGAAVVSDRAAVRWTGYLKAPSSETFTFNLQTSADSTATLLIDGQKVVGTSRAASGAKALVVGALHSVQVLVYGRPEGFAEEAAAAAAAAAAIGELPAAERAQAAALRRGGAANDAAVYVDMTPEELPTLHPKSTVCGVKKGSRRGRNGNAEKPSPAEKELVQDYTHLLRTATAIIDTVNEEGGIGGAVHSNQLTGGGSGGGDGLL